MLSWIYRSSFYSTALLYPHANSVPQPCNAASVIRMFKPRPTHGSSPFFENKSSRAECSLITAKLKMGQTGNVVDMKDVELAHILYIDILWQFTDVFVFVCEWVILPMHLVINSWNKFSCTGSSAPLSDVFTDVMCVYCTNIYTFPFWSVWLKTHFALCFTK